MTAVLAGVERGLIEVAVETSGFIYPSALNPDEVRHMGWLVRQGLFAEHDGVFALTEAGYAGHTRPTGGA